MDTAPRERGSVRKDGLAEKQRPSFVTFPLRFCQTAGPPTPRSRWRRIGDVADIVLIEIGRQAVAHNLTLGRFDEADAIRRELHFLLAVVDR